MAYELWQWLRSLEPEFLVLLMLPFLVAAAGLLRLFIDSRKRG
jgi:hypothetical protein